MSRFALGALAAAVSVLTRPGLALADPADSGNAAAAPAQTIEVVAKRKRLNDDRNSVETRSGASVYKLDSEAIAAMPAGDNAPLNQVLLQAPEVAQDSFGQFHVRGEHNGVQYRLDGVALPEGIAVFGQSLDPRLIDSVSLVTGALPAEYGLRTAGIIDIRTKGGQLDSGGTVSLYGGSHGTLQPSFSAAGSAGRWNYFVSADALQNDLGIESPDGSRNPLHDRTKQSHAFAYVENRLDAENRIGVALGSSNGRFQIPNLRDSQPTLGYVVNGQSSFPSSQLDENQREVTQFGFVSLRHGSGPLEWQTSIVSRYSTLSFSPDPIGDLLYNGIAQTAYKRDNALALQSDAAYKLGPAHTLRGGLMLQRDRTLSLTDSLVLATDSQGNQIAPDVPIGIVDNAGQTATSTSLYLQDEWRALPTLTVNYGLRWDRYRAWSSGSQLSPRLNAVWKASPATTLHGGYSRYFSPPPFELVGSETIARFANTSAAPAVTQNDTPQAERANYFDLGLDHDFGAGLTAGIDLYYKTSKHLLDEGQFGAPIILTPFNYAQGKQYGAEFKLNYAGPRFSAYANLALQRAMGKRIESAQFNFSAEELAYIANHFISLDHEQRTTASAGVSTLWRGTRWSADAIVGSGLRSTLVLPNGNEIPNGDHLPTYTQINLGASREFSFESIGSIKLRLDLINAFDKVYQIRDGSGVGVGAPQYGPRRGVFVGVSKEF